MDNRKGIRLKQSTEVYSFVVMQSMTQNTVRSNESTLIWRENDE